MARGNGTKDVQWKNTINAYKGIAAVAIAYFYHYKIGNCETRGARS